MNFWHLVPDAPRYPARPCPGQAVELWIGTWPIETDQRVHVACHVLSRDGRHEAHDVDAVWDHNQGPNSYWCARVRPFADGDIVEYRGRRGLGPVRSAGGMLFAMSDTMQHPTDSRGQASFVGVLFGFAVVAGVHLYDRALQPSHTSGDVTGEL